MREADHDLEGYPRWDLAPLPLPPRSRLYHLAPIGVGSSEVESFTGYVVRLATAHCVTPFVLARREIMPAFAPDHRAEIEWQLGALMGCAARRLNGLEPGAGRWVEVLAALTGRPDLRSLTLLPWAGVLASHDLLRTTLAWCPACYAAWREAAQEVYQPLLWTLRAVTVCPRHRQPLQDRCSACRRPQPLIAPAIRPGYCTACDHWLGEPDGGVQTGNSSPPAAAWAWRLWGAEAVGEMLSASPLLGAPFPSGRVKAIIEECIASLGSDEPLRTFAHLAWDTIEVWRRGAAIPMLGSLLRLCHYLGTTPRQFLLLGAAAMAPRSDLWSVPPTASRPRRPRGSFDVEMARRRFQAVVAGTPESLPSVPEMARHLGCADWDLRRHLPEECRALVEQRTAQRKQAVSAAAARRCAEVRRATITVHEQGLYPNGRRVAALLTNPPDLIRVEVRAAWQETLRELGWQPRKRKGTYLA